MISEDTYRELVASFNFSEAEQSRPARISEGQRMTTEAYGTWKRFRDERAYVRTMGRGV